MMVWLAEDAALANVGTSTGKGVASGVQAALTRNSTSNTKSRTDIRTIKIGLRPGGFGQPGANNRSLEHADGSCGIEKAEDGECNGSTAIIAPAQHRIQTGHNDNQPRHIEIIGDHARCP